MGLKESLIESKLMLIGEMPKNKPDNPTILKLNATDKTASSTMSNLFSFAANKRLTRQYPGAMSTKVKPKTMLKIAKTESAGIMYTKSSVNRVYITIIPNQRMGFTF
jgi:hypothetical protein